MLRRVSGVFTLGLSAALLFACCPAHAGFWDRGPEPQPPPIHVYDYTRPPVWTPNGWAHVPVEVHFPRTHPTVIIPPQNVEPLPPPPPRRRVPVRAAPPERPDPRYEYAPMPLPKLPPRRTLTK